MGLRIILFIAALLAFCGATRAQVVSGPGSSTTNAVVTFSDATGKRLRSNAGALFDGTNLTLNGWIALSGLSNRLSVAEGQLLLDGAAVGGGEQIWTNDGAFIYPSGTGPNFPDGSAPGPPLVIRQDGSLFIGTNVAQDVNELQEPRVMKQSYAVMMTSSNEPSDISILGRVVNDENFDFYSSYMLEATGDKDHSATSFDLQSGTTNGGFAQIAMVTDPAGYGGGTKILLFNPDLKFSVNSNGLTSAAGGFASTDTTAAVTIAATGWTNTFGKIAVVYFDGTAVTAIVKNNAGTAVYTNTAAATGMSSVLLQPSGAVILSGTGVAGRAAPL